MEDALRGNVIYYNAKDSRSLNPCSNGRCSARNEKKRQQTSRKKVLILVLMEDALRDLFKQALWHWLSGLNPCSNGRCSARFSNQFIINDKLSLNPCSNGRCSASL